MLLDSFDITTATGNHICMVHRPLGLRIPEFQALIPGGKLSQDILKLTLKYVLLALEFLHSVCHLAHTGKLPNYYSLFLSRVGLYLSLSVEVSDHFPDIQAKNIPWTSVMRTYPRSLKKRKFVIQVHVRSVEIALSILLAKCA
jgi:hypothetical protein